MASSFAKLERLKSAKSKKTKPLMAH
jgi:hypothetical protein